jgi:large repetitive protein
LPHDREHPPVHDHGELGHRGLKDVVLADFTDQVSVSSCGEVKVTKATDPAGKAGTFPYTLSRSDNSALNFDGDTSVTGSLTGDGDSNLITDLKAGTNYTLAEGALDPAWALQTISCTTGGTTYDVYPGAADFTVKVSTIADCTITNKLQEGTLTVIKHVVNDNGGGASAGDFTIGLNDAGNTTFSGDEGGTQNTFVDGYGYDVTESGPSGYDATYVGDCTGSIEAGVDKTCTVTNDDVAPKLTVIKTVINDNGGTAVASDFTLDSGWTNDSPDDFAGDESGATVTLDAGSYGVTESGPSGYARSDSADCAGSIAIGQTKTCTVTNNDQPAHLIVIKHVINDNGGSATAASFTSTPVGPPIRRTTSPGLRRAPRSRSTPAPTVSPRPARPGTRDPTRPTARARSVWVRPRPALSPTTTSRRS